MNRKQRKRLNIFAICMLAFALYLNFIYKGGDTKKTTDSVPPTTFVNSPPSK